MRVLKEMFLVARLPLLAIVLLFGGTLALLGVQAILPDNVEHWIGTILLMALIVLLAVMVVAVWIVAAMEQVRKKKAKGE